MRVRVSMTHEKSATKFVQRKRLLRTLVVVTSANVHSNVLVLEEKHDANGVVQLVHLVEVRNVLDIDSIYDGHILELDDDSSQRLVHKHALRSGFLAPTYHNDSVLLTEDGLVDRPCVWQSNEIVSHGLRIRVLSARSRRNS